MKAITGRQIALELEQIPALLRCETEWVVDWIERLETGRAGLYLVLIFIGSGLYGAAMGCWRAPLQAFYTALKFPLVIVLTTLGTTLLNGMLAPLLGLNISFRQSWLAVLMSFTIASVILGSFSPLAFFIVWNTPPLSATTEIPWLAYNFTQLAHVAIIAFAGVAANLRLLRLLRALGGSAAVARKILLAWLASNLFLGSQMSWILRPFIGSPGLPLEFLRPDAFQGNFFETVFNAARRLISF